MRPCERYGKMYRTERKKALSFGEVSPCHLKTQKERSLGYMEENKETLELLRKIEKNNRIQTYAGYARTALVLVCAVCIVVLTCAVMKLMPQINAILGQAQGAVNQVGTVLDYLEQTSAQLAQVDMQGMVSNVDGLVTTGQQSLEATMEKLNSVDFEALNKAITDLAAVTQSLANVTRIFGR